MKIVLSAPDTVKWNAGGDWKAGFLVALKATVAPMYETVEIRDNLNTVLATYVREWAPGP